MAVNVIFQFIQLIFNCTLGDTATETAFVWRQYVNGIVRAWLALFVCILILGDDAITKITSTLPLVYKALSTYGGNTTKSKKY